MEIKFPCKIKLTFENKIGVIITKESNINDIRDFVNFTTNCERKVVTESYKNRTNNPNIIVSDLYLSLVSMKVEDI